MNIFAVDSCPVKSGTILPDKLTVKMPLETAQIVSTVLRKLLPKPPEFLYKSTHANHPCVYWSGQTRGNFIWLINHGIALGEEYTRRYGRTHKSIRVLQLAEDYAYALPNSDEVVPFVQCMPDEYKSSDPHRSYRGYVRDKSYFFTGFNKGRDFTSEYETGEEL